MDKTINVKVGGNHLSKDSKNAGVRGEANVTTLRITFDEGWDIYTKKITFWDARGLNPVVIDLLPHMADESGRTYFVPIPAEPMAESGMIMFVIEGTKDDKVQRSFSDTLFVADAPIAENAGQPVPPTEDELTQLQGEIELIKGDILGARTASDEAEMSMNLAETHSLASKHYSEISTAKAEEAERMAGVAEDSAKKAQDAVGKTSYIGDNGNWFAWDSTTEAFYDTGVKAQSGSTVYLGDNPPDEADVWVDTGGEADAVTAYEIAVKNGFEGTEEEWLESLHATVQESLFANAVKGTASGRSVFVNDVSPIEHKVRVNLTSDTITDFSSVKVKKHSKNFLEHRFKPGVTESQNGVTITGNDDGSIALNGTVARFFGPNILDDSNPLKLPYGTYTFSHEGDLPTGAFMSMVIDVGNGINVTKEKPIANVYNDITMCWIIADEGTVFDNVVIKPQIEQGEIATEYESPYVFESYTPDSAGIIHGLTASSFIKLSTDNDVAVFDVEYNKNITAPNTAELIETIKVTESNLLSIIRTHAPNGTPYDFKAMYIHHEVKPCTIDNTILFGAYDHADAVTFDNHLCKFQVRNTATTSGRFISAHFDVIGGVWTAFGVGTTIQGSPTAVTMERDFKPYKGETIKGIKIKGYTTSLEVGSVFKIYGVRA